jgi:hypothetical protein
LPSVLQPEEVVEVFLGDTLEEAMAYAVAALGPDLSVRRARKVRRGMQGLVGKDRYEVVAIPSPSVSPEGALESAFDALLLQAESAEAPTSTTPQRRTTRPAAPAPPPTPHPAPSVAEHAARLPEPVTLTQIAAPVVLEAQPVEALQLVSPAAPAAVLEQAAVVEPVPVVEAPTAVVEAPATVVEAPVATKRTASKRAPRTKKAAAPLTSLGWSRQALIALGLPAPVLDALPHDEPADDLGWVVALAVAMSSVLPAPAALDEEHPLVVNGYGMAGVLGLLDAASRGLTPGTITVGDRTAAATATELALVVRTAVVG